MNIKQFGKDVLAQDRDAIREHFCDDGDAPQLASSNAHWQTH